MEALADIFPFYSIEFPFITYGGFTPASVVPG